MLFDSRHDALVRLRGRKAVLVAWASGAAALGVLAKAIDSDVLGIAAAAAGALLLAAVAVLVIKEQGIVVDDEARVASFDVLSGMRVEPQQLRGISPYLLGVDEEVLRHSAAQARAHVPYIRRDGHRLLDAAMVRALDGERPMVVVLGPSKAGKSRLLYEAAVERVGAGTVFAPLGPTQLVRLLRGDDLAFNRCSSTRVIWLDDIEPFVAGQGESLTPRLLMMANAGGPRTIFLATYGGKGSRRLPQDEQAKLVEPVREVLSHAIEVPISSDLSEDEIARASAAFPQEVVEALGQHGIGEYMIAAPELIRKLTTGRHPGEDDCPVGVAVAWITIDWARVGRTAGIGRERLRELIGAYSPAPVSDAELERGIAWAQRSLYSSIALVGRDLTAFDFIVSYADGESHRSVKDEIWPYALEDASGSEALEVGIRAVALGRPEQAEAAMQIAEASDDDHVAGTAQVNLGVVAWRRDDFQSALELFTTASSNADPQIAGAGLTRLGAVHAVLADWHRSKEAFEAAIRLDDPDLTMRGLVGVGAALVGLGDLDGAERAYREAIANPRGHWTAIAIRDLGTVLAERGDFDGAVQAYREAIDGGDEVTAASSMDRLGDLLRDRGDLIAAEQAYRDAIATGADGWAPIAMRDLGNLLVQTGDLEGAEEAYRAAIATGHERAAAGAMDRLGDLLRARGDLAAAEQAYRDVIAIGNRFWTSIAMKDLGDLLAERGDLAGAEQAYRDAIEAGDLTASVGLADVLLRTGDLEGAERAFRDAIASGDEIWVPLALEGLADLLARRGDDEGAERAYRDAVLTGDESIAPMALARLVEALGRRGEIEAAEQACSHAATLNNEVLGAASMAIRGEFLRAHGDVDGARKAFRAAADTGIAPYCTGAEAALRELASTGDEPQP